ncbi:YqaJ viral recombinase family protein [Azoarcus sp. L1K30]|uniref:YqaJ viral recombinase family nuclease n=1 Tax=Azoarcus sp. L1K30 TaxID=2820277 RepID=UPI001B8177F7|nr:YqaJ viral recombinase family protein [Azoarcus sp. L1K30]MBR0568388.1 YqaJ viral recombinase family protein [Azoarcus sp. L1K30]
MNAPTKREQFLADRQSGLGASDISAILGYNSFRSPVEVYLEKIGDLPADESSMRLRFGQHNEEFVAKEYEQATGMRVQRYNPMLRHPDYPCVLGHVDRLVIPPGQKVAAHKGLIRTDRGLEAKTVDPFVFRTSGEWGEAGTDEVPTSYMIQCATYMSLTNCSRWDLAALIGSGAAPLAIYHLSRDRELEEELLRRASEWWQAHVVARVAPDPQSEEDVALLFPQATKRDPVVATPEIVDLVDLLKGLKQEEKEIEDKIAEASRDIKAFMGAAGELILPGTEFDKKPTKLATWNNRKGRTGFDLDAFVGHLCPGGLPGEHALFIEDAKRTFTTRGEPGRTFLLK